MKYVSKIYCLLKPPPRKKNTQNSEKKRYKIDLDFDVIYTKHMLIIYLKIIYYLFFYKT